MLAANTSQLSQDDTVWLELVEPPAPPLIPLVLPPPLPATTLSGVPFGGPSALGAARHFEQAARPHTVEARPHASHHKTHHESRQKAHVSRHSSTRPAASVRLAEHYLGQEARWLHLRNYTAAGGYTNDCADFISAVLQDTGRLHGHYINVGVMEGALQHQGWHPVSASRAMPGDVWVTSSDSHTEMVTHRGATQMIGANGTSVEVVSFTGDWTSGRFYHHA
jgi:hypothetical protein